MSYYFGVGYAGDQGACVLECDARTDRIIGKTRGFFTRAAFCDEHIMFREKIDEPVVQRLIKRSRELFECRDSRLIMPVGNSDENAISVAKDVEAAGWHVFYDEKNYPVQATDMKTYVELRDLMLDDEPELELKLTWLFYSLMKDDGTSSEYICQPGIWGKVAPEWSDDIKDVYGGKRGDVL